MPSYELSNGSIIQQENEDPDRCVLSFRGSFDATTVVELNDIGVINKIIGDDTVGTLIFDLSQTSFLDASGLRCLLATQRHTREANKQLRLRYISEPVGRLLEIAMITEYFTYEETP